MHMHLMNQQSDRVLSCIWEIYGPIGKLLEVACLNGRFTEPRVPEKVQDKLLKRQSTCVLINFCSMLGVGNDIKLCSYDGESEWSSDVAKLLPGHDLLAHYGVY